MKIVVLTYAAHWNALQHKLTKSADLTGEIMHFVDRSPKTLVKPYQEGKFDEFPGINQLLGRFLDELGFIKSPPQLPSSTNKVQTYSDLPSACKDPDLNEEGLYQLAQQWYRLNIITNGIEIYNELQELVHLCKAEILEEHDHDIFAIDFEAPEIKQLFELIDALNNEVFRLRQSDTTLLEWYENPDSPTWGYLYERVGDYLLANNQITNKQPTIPAVENEHTKHRLTYWIRHLNSTPELIKSIFQQKISSSPQEEKEKFTHETYATLVLILTAALTDSKSRKRKQPPELIQLFFKLRGTTPQLVKFYKTGATKPFPVIHLLLGRLLTQKDAIAPEELSSEEPNKKNNPIKTPILTENLESDQLTIPDAIQRAGLIIRLGEERSIPTLGWERAMKLTYFALKEIEIEEAAGIATTQASFQMESELEEIQDALIQGDITTYRWYQNSDNQKWGHIYDAVGDHLKEKGRIKKKNSTPKANTIQSKHSHRLSEWLQKTDAPSSKIDQILRSIKWRIRSRQTR